MTIKLIIVDTIAKSTFDLQGFYSEKTLTSLLIKTIYFARSYVYLLAALYGNKLC